MVPRPRKDGQIGGYGGHGWNRRDYVNRQRQQSEKKKGCPLGAFLFLAGAAAIGSIGGGAGLGVHRGVEAILSAF